MSLLLYGVEEAFWAILRDDFFTGRCKCLEISRIFSNFLPLSGNVRVAIGVAELDEPSPEGSLEVFDRREAELELLGDGLGF